MRHWQKYIKKHKTYDKYVVPSDFNFGTVVVIPCFDELNLLTTLKSIQQCLPPKNPVSVLVVVNSCETTDESVVLQNRKTYDEVIAFTKKQNLPELSFHTLLCENLPRKHSGVGLARKIGMEWAIRGFLQSNNSDGVIVSLDADCTVSENYLFSIENQFLTYSPNCCILNFRHRVPENESSLRNAIVQYEQYIWYFRDSLKAIDFPYYYHTIGSAFAVSADAYVRVGGIGRQQGGEDFYFLQKIFQLEKTVELMDTFVYPEARFSERIPFGTGPALEKILSSPDGILNVYSIEAFSALKSFFDLRVEFYKQPNEIILKLISDLHISVQQFLAENNLLSAITDCNENSATVLTFQKRFFHHFNAFAIIKYMNFVHDKFFELTPIHKAKDKLDDLL
ncbi:MAG TPA: hypothetical protein VLZ33_00170 [Dysgonamonadaceae bacterium]|nr:hypothetical protein [Dysgonamonadaceae bacterium]